MKKNNINSSEEELLFNLENKPIVSILTITYKHEKFIRDTIEGVLTQNVNFPVEFIVADDCSPDQTEAIIQEYIDNHPKGHWIQYVKHDVNKGMIPNFVWGLNRCKGKYIALCEGDDYWIDSFKLQKQVDFLEQNSGYSGVGTNSEVIYDLKDRQTHVFSEYYEGIYELRDFIENRPFHTATFIFRNSLKSHEYFYDVLSADRLLYLLVALNGNVKYFEDTTAVYRKNEGGVSSRVDSAQMKRDLNFVKILTPHLKEVELVQLKRFINKTILSYSHSISFVDFIKSGLSFLWLSLKLSLNDRNYFKNGLSKASFLKQSIILVFNCRKGISL